MFITSLPNIDAPVVIITPDTTDSEYNSIDPFSHILTWHQKSETLSPSDFRLHCQFLDCNTCPYNEHNTPNNNRACVPHFINNVLAEMPELFI